MIGAVSEVTQDPEKAGNAMKILSLRLRGMKGEVEEVESGASEGMESISKMQTQILNMTKGRVNIFDENGDFKSTYDIMKGIAEVWDDLSKIDQAELLETIAGKHRANDVGALIKNWGNAEKMAETGLNSAGSAAKENERTVNSLQGRINALTAAWQEFANTVMSSDFLKGLASTATSALEVITKLVDTVGTLPSLAGLAVAGLSMTDTFKNSMPFKVIEDEAARTGHKIQSTFVGSFSELKNTKGFSYSKEFSQGLIRDQQNLQNFARALRNGADAQTAFNQHMMNSSSVFQERAKIMTREEAQVKNLGKVMNETSRSARMSEVAFQAQNTTLSNVRSMMKQYDGDMKNVGLTQQQFVSAVGQSNPVLGKYLSGLNGAKTSMFGYIASLVSAKVATFALEAASIALNATLTIGIGLIIGGAISAIANWIQAEENLAQKIDEVTSSYKEQHNELIKNKSGFKNLAESYSKLSKGVNSLTGKNISLMPDEYEEYKNVANQIADMVPSLVKGYDEQGNAILNCAGDVDTLTEAYNNLIIAENNKLLNGDGKEFAGLSDTIKDLQNDYDDLTNSSDATWWKPFSWGDKKNSLQASNAMEEIFGLPEITEESIDSYIRNAEELATERADRFSIIGQALRDKMSETGLEVDGIETPDPTWANSTEWSDYIYGVYQQYPEVVRAAIDDMNMQLDGAATETRDSMLAYMENAFLKGDYSNLDEEMQAIANNIIGGIDSEFIHSIIGDLEGEEARNALTGWINNFLSSLDDMGDNAQEKLKSAFDSSDIFASGKLSFGEYNKQLQEAEKLIDSLSLDDEVKKELKLSLNVDEVEEQFNSTVAALEKIGVKSADALVSGLSSSELDYIQELVIEGDIDWSGMTPEQVEAEVSRLVEMAKNLSFEFELSVKVKELEKLNEAVTQSLSGIGLSVDSEGVNSIATIEGIFGGLDGYDPSKLFERTANGIRMNADEFRRLNNEYKNTNLDGLNKKMSALGDKYLETRSELSELTYGTEEYNLKVGELDGLEAQINELEMLTSQYEGLTSAYNEWQMAEEAGSQRDMYESVIEGFEAIGDEISRGWYDDATIEFIELLSGKDLSTAGIEEVKSAWQGLGKTIENTSYSVKDFFTVNADGESTNDGVYNFLDAVGQLEEEAFGGLDVVKRDGSGNIIGFDFKIAGGDDVIAEALGVSEELVQIMVRAADDAGFVVSMDGTFQQLDVLKEKAAEAAVALKDTFKATEHTFFQDGSEDGILADYNEAVKVWETFKANKNADGTVNMSVEGAEEAFTLVSTLQSMVDKLNEPVYMELKTSQVEKDMQDPLSKLQEYERLVQTEHQLKLKGTDTSEIDASQEEILDYFEGLNPEIKARLGIDNLTRSDLQSKIETGELEIPATIDLQVEMNDTLKDMVNIALYNAGLLGEGEEGKAELEKRVDVSLYAGEVDASDVENATDEAVENAGGDDNTVEATANVDVESGEVNVSDVENVTNQAVENIAKGVEDATINPIKASQKVIVEQEAYQESFEDFQQDHTWPLYGMSQTQRKVIFDLEVSNPEIFEDYEEKDRVVAYKYIAENEEFFTGASDDVEKKIVLDYVVENGEEAWNELGLDGQTQYIRRQEVVVDYIANHEELDNYTPEEKRVIARYLADPSELDNFTPEGKEAVAKFRAEHSEVDNWTPDQKEGLAKYYKDSSEVDAYNPNNIDRTVTYGKDSSRVDAYNPSNFTRSVTYNFLTSGFEALQSKLSSLGISIPFFADGTAHANGSAFVEGTAGKSGRAFKQGNWGIKGSGTALVGELGQELVVRDGKFFTIGDNGAEFFDYKPNDIIFNAGQTKQLFEQGKIVNGKTRGRAVSNGTAFANGKLPSIGKAFGDGGSTGEGGAGRAGSGSSVSLSGSSKSSSKSSSSSSDASKEAEEFKEKLDWIEVAIDRIERAISRLDLRASSVFNKWSTRNSALTSEMDEIRKMIETQEAAAVRYQQEADSLGLSSEYVAKIKDGTIDIETITDEDLKEKIDEYMQWHEKSLDALEAAEQAREDLSSKYVERFENVITEYEGILSLIEAEKNLLDEFINQSEAQGWLVSADFYTALATNEQKTFDALKEERDRLLAEFNDAIVNGGIDETSEQWVEFCNSINETTLAMEESKTQLLEYQQTLQQLNWEVFDMMQDRISKITDESEFLIDLLSSDKLYVEEGKGAGQFTDAGMATMGLQGVNYNVAMAQADKYAEEIEKIAKELETDPLDTELQERYWELVAAQQDAILSAQNYKEAIRDMVEEGIQLELDALQELIDKRNEALDAEKDAYEYQKKVKEQTEEIAALEKQMAAYRGDNSEEVRSKVQELKISLEEAEQELEETEYDKYISDQEKLMDDLYLEYETILNERLDNLELLITEMTAEINANSGSIAETLSEKAESVGYDLSQSMSTIWDASANKITDASGEVKNVIATYGDNFLAKFTTTNDALSDISSNIASMIGQLNTLAGTKVKTAQETAAEQARRAAEERKRQEEAANNNSNNNNNNQNSSSDNNGSISIGGKINAGNATIYATSSGTGGGSQYFANDPIYTVLKEQGGYLQVRYHKLSSGVTGWFKKSDVSAYAAGKRNLLSDEVAWTQENGREFIIRPSDGAILTPLAKNDSVLNAAASNNLWNMANSPAEFIRDSLGIGGINAPVGSSGAASISQNFEQIVFSMPNVKNYDEMLAQMQKDKNFQRLIDSMGIDQIAGKSSLRKGKSIR